MVVNKKKGGKMPSKVVKKVDKVKTKVTREGKNVGVSNKGPAKRNKVIKTTKASKMLISSKTRSSVEKTKKAFEPTKRKSTTASPKGKSSEKSSSPTKVSLKQTKQNTTKSTPEKDKDSKKKKFLKPISSLTSTQTTKKTKKSNTVPPRTTRGASNIGSSKTQQSKRVVESNLGKLKSPSKKQSPSKHDNNTNKNAGKKQDDGNKMSPKGRPRKNELKKQSIGTRKNNKSPTIKAKQPSPSKQLGKNVKNNNTDAKKSPQKLKEFQKSSSDAKLKSVGKINTSPATKILSKLKTKDKVTRKEVAFTPNVASKGIKQRRANDGKEGIKKRGLQEPSKGITEKDKSTKDHVVKTRKTLGIDNIDKDEDDRSDKVKKKTASTKPNDKPKNKVSNESRRSLRNDPPVVTKNKVEKRKTKLSKAKLAQRQMKKMQTLGLLGAPPRRAASLNAAAMVHFMYDTEIASSTSPGQNSMQSKNISTKDSDNTTIQKKNSATVGKEKDRNKKATETNKQSNSQIPRKVKQSKIQIKTESSDDSEEEADESVSENINAKKNKSPPEQTTVTTDGTNSEKLKDKIIKTQKKKIVGGTNKLKNVVKVSSPFISSSESEEDDEDDDNTTSVTIKPKNVFDETDESLDTSKEKNKVPTKRKNSKSKKKPQKIKKRKKTLRDEFNMDIRDMIVKKRIASLNASAIMSASYSSNQSDKTKVNELAVIKVGDARANNYEFSTTDMPKHLTALLSKVDDEGTSALANTSVPNRTTNLSRKSKLTDSSILNEPNIASPIASSTPSSKRSSSENKNMLKNLKIQRSKVSREEQRRMQEKELNKYKPKEGKNNQEKDTVHSAKNENSSKLKEKNRIKNKPKFSKAIGTRFADFDEDFEGSEPIIVEIEDERIKSQLIASAMKKASSGSSKTSPISVLPLKKRHIVKGNEEEYKNKPKYKKRRKRKVSSREVIVTLSSSSSDEDEEGYDKVKISSGSHSESSSGEESDSNSSRSEDGSDEESEEEIEEICTEGARASANNQVIKYNHIRPSSAGVQGHSALNTEMNKVDVIVDGRSHSVVAGMAYQVVQRFETISTTTAVVPRFRAPGPPSANEQAPSDSSSSSTSGAAAPRASRKYTPLGALANLQPGNNTTTSHKTQHHSSPVTGLVQPQPLQGSTQVHTSSSNTESRHPLQPSSDSHQGHGSNASSRFSSTIQHQGFYQPAGPLIRSASPVGGQSSAGGSSPSHPPTATVQPTVFCTTTAGSSSIRSATVTGVTRGSAGANSDYKGTGSTSPVKPTPQSAASFPAPVAPTGYSYSTAALSSAYGVSPYPHGYPSIYPNPPPAHVAQGTPFYPYPPSAIPFYPTSHYPYAAYPPQSSTEAVTYPYPPSTLAAHPAVPPPPPHVAYPGQYLVAPFQQISSDSGVNSALSDASGRTTQVALPSSAAAYYYGGYPYPYSAAAAGRIMAPILALAPPPNGIVPAHQTSVYSYSVQQHPSLVPPALNGVPAHYQAQYQAAHQPQQPGTASANMTSSQLQTNGNLDPPVAHQALSEVPQNIHDSVKSSRESEFGIKLGGGSKRLDPHKAHHHNVQPTPIGQETGISASADTQTTSHRKHKSTTNVTSESYGDEVIILEKDMHKRAEDLAGKISATVTITTNATSKLSGGNPREKNDFLPVHNNVSSGPSSKVSKHGTHQSNTSATNKQNYSKEPLIGGKVLVEPSKVVPNLSNLKPIPPNSSNAKPLMSNNPSQHSSNLSAMMATITPIYAPTSMTTEQSTAFTPVPTKSSLRDYRKPKPKGVQAQAPHISKISTNAATNNRFTVPMDCPCRVVPDEISVTTVIGPPGNKSKAPSHHQEPAIISCYPVTKSTSHGSTKRHVSASTDASMAKKMKSSPSQQDQQYPFPKGLTITEVNVPTPTHNPLGLLINPLNVCATSLQQHQEEEDDDVIPVLHIPELSGISHSESSISKVRMQHNPTFGGKNTSSRLPSGISNIRPLVQGAFPKGFNSNATTSGHPGMPSGLLRMTATSLQQKSFQSQLNVPQAPHNMLTLHSRPTAATSSIPKITSKDVKSRMALNKIGLKASSQTYLSIPKSKHRPTLKPSKASVPATITMSMAESAVSAVQPNTFKPVPARSKYSANSKQSIPGVTGSPTKKGSQVSSPSSSRSSSRNSSLSPRDRSGSMSSKNNSFSSGTSGGTSSPKSSQSAKKKTSSIGYDPKSPLVSWNVRNSCAPKTSNGWNWKGEGKIQKVYLNNEDPPINRICYASMKHVEGDVVKPRDCIVLASGHRKRDLPFIAKVTSLWENPEDGEMCMSLLWYYRPEHVDSGRKFDDLQDEIFASKHRDFTSVACIEDKCYVMTFNEYCRYRKFQRMVYQDITPAYSIVPELMEGYDRADLLPRCEVAPDRVFLCRRVYDPRQKRIFKLGKHPY